MKSEPVVIRFLGIITNFTYFSRCLVSYGFFQILWINANVSAYHLYEAALYSIWARCASGLPNHVSR